MNTLYILSGVGLLSLIAEIVNFKKGLVIIVLIGLVTAAAMAVLEWGTSQHYYNDMLVFDNSAIAFTVLIVLISIFWFWMAEDFFADLYNVTDRMSLIVFAVAGAVIMVSFNNMAMLFLGIEVLSISLYTLTGSNKNGLPSNEASLKYFLMGSFATGFLLMGIALVYGATGSFNLSEITSRISASNLPSFAYVGILLLGVGVAFKIAAVPFHFWAPDVYDGAPISVTAFMATVVKIAAIGAFYKVFICFLPAQSQWTIILQVITVLTLVIANGTAVFQSRIKRMLAYSSVGQVGYILLAFVSNPEKSKSTMIYYLAAYAVASITTFAVVQVVGENNRFKGLIKRNKLLAIIMSVALLSLAGIPPLSGFFAKYLVFVLAIANGHTTLAVVAIVTSLIGVFYYFRVIVAIFSDDTHSDFIAIPLSQRLLFIVLTLITLYLGIFPDQFITLLE
jgi:NADH-quinone oxidoreductase subunit N